ncbi:MAG: hypothetical protein HY744_29475, partial [Deltaproteobacteria bacterium]|nr:hypothetical protein [Deltaproteobacteria bacterium]
MNIEFVTLEEVIAAARLQYASLVPESAGYIVLGIGQSMGEAPAVVEGPRVSLSTEGSVLLAEPRCSGTAAEACASVRRLFELMLRVSQGWMPALQAVAADAGNQDLQRLLGNTARALIPINRGAAKRAIARLARETARARQRGWLEGERANGEPEAAVARAEAGVQTPLAGTTPPPTATAARAARDGPAARAIPSFAEPCVPAAWSPTPSPAAAADPDWSSAPAPVASLSPTPAPSREPTPTVAEAICAPAQPSQPLRAPVPPAAEQWCIPPTPQPDVAHQAPRRWDDPLDETSGPLPRRAAAAAADVPKPAHEPAPLVPEPIIAIGGSAPAASPAPGADATEDHGAEPAVPEPSAPEHEIEDDTGTLLGLGPVAVSREPAAGSLAPASSTAAGDSDGSSARAAAERTPAGVNRLAQRAERGRAAPPGDRTGTTARRAAASA